MEFLMMLIFAVVSFFVTAVNLDTTAANFHLAEKACSKLASNSHVKSFDSSVATCENGTVIVEFQKKARE